MVTAARVGPPAPVAARHPAVPERHRPRPQPAAWAEASQTEPSPVVTAARAGPRRPQAARFPAVPESHRQRRMRLAAMEVPKMATGATPAPAVQPHPTVPAALRRLQARPAAQVELVFWTDRVSQGGAGGNASASSKAETTGSGSAMHPEAKADHPSGLALVRRAAQLRTASPYRTA